MVSDIVSGGKRMLFMPYGNSKTLRPLTFQERTGERSAKLFMVCLLQKRQISLNPPKTSSLKSIFLIS
jgi:hypothetical protein